MIDLLDDGDHQLARHRFAPGHFTAGGFVVSPGGDELLMVLHRRLGKWMQPGGHIDGDDANLCAAARREIAEETGLADLAPGCLLFDLDVHAIPASEREPAHHHFDVRFLFTAQSTHVEAADDVADVRWVPLDEAARLGDESVARAVAKLMLRS